LTIASKGDAPFVVRRLRQVLEQRLGPDWAEWLNAARRFREVVRASSMDWAAQEAAYDAFFANTVDADRLTARVPASSEEAAFLAAPEIETATAASSPDASPGAAQPSGLVSLVGAGPGDAGLLTIRAHERLMHADVIVYDRLAATAVPTDLASHVELRCVGKLAGRHPVPQEETNELLIRLARQGRRVVRLKGGDPFVFGRGGEEAAALDRARIPFEVVPGISAGIAVPAYAGIPLTYRGEAVRATFLTAHETEKPDGEQQRWDLIATDKNTTIVGFMGVLNLTKVVTELTRAGMDPET
ncbi:MAG: uroporphyrinogen-III C-methyltransferase, partial [bacterium]|nr:uroporphyrinogen-III C-methyltransferase [bacterium]